MVEHIEEALMEWQSGAKYGGYQDVVLLHVDFHLAKGCGDGLGFVVELAAELVCHYPAYAAYVLAEEKAVALVGLVAQLIHVLV